MVLFCYSFGLSGLPLELELFDWPQQVFALVPRGSQQFTYANVAGPGATSVTGHFLTEITQVFLKLFCRVDSFCIFFRI